MEKLTLKEQYKILDDYFSLIEDETLEDLSFQYPEELRQMCVLLSLDFQLEIEGYNGENNSDRRILS